MKFFSTKDMSVHSVVKCCQQMFQVDLPGARILRND